MMNGNGVTAFGSHMLLPSAGVRVMKAAEPVGSKSQPASTRLELLTNSCALTAAGECHRRLVLKATEVDVRPQPPTSFSQRDRIRQQWILRRKPRGPEPELVGPVPMRYLPVGIKFPPQQTKTVRKFPFFLAAAAWKTRILAPLPQ